MAKGEWGISIKVQVILADAGIIWPLSLSHDRLFCSYKLKGSNDCDTRGRGFKNTV